MALPAYDQSPLVAKDHNLPPLAEQLADETAALAQRAADLAASAGRCAVTDADTAGKATLLAKMIRTHVQDIDAAREERKKPFLEAGRTVDQHFAGIASVIVQYDAKKRPIGGPLFDVLQKIDGYRREQERLAEQERQRLAEEARQERLKAEAAERARQEAEAARRREQEEAERRIREAEEAARKAGDREAEAKAAQDAAERKARQDADAAERRQRDMQAEIDRRAAEDRAAELERQAKAMEAAPIDSGYGAKANRRETWSGKITDLKKAVAHAIKIDRAGVEEAVQKIVDRQIRAKVREFPGVDIKPDSTTVIR